MELHFANPSRSYDPTRHAVRFWGYDRSTEVSFFVAEDALFRLQPSPTSKDSDFLEAFDAHDRHCPNLAMMASASVSTAPALRLLIQRSQSCTS